MPVGRDEWRHPEAGESYPYDSRWLRPMTPAEVLSMQTCDGVAEQDWLESRRRLRAYLTALDAGKPLLDLVAILAGGRPGPGEMRVPPGIARVLDLDGRRRELASRYAWAVPTEAALGLAGDHGPLLEVGAGTGYWASLLRARGVDVLATDVAPPGEGNAYHHAGPAWTRVERLAAADAVRTYPGRTLLMCWPPPDDDAAGYAALRAYTGDVLVYVGGGADGPTGTPRLHAELALNWTVTDELALPSWPGIPDRLTVRRRNPRRRPLRARNRCPQCARFMPIAAAGRCDGCFARTPPALALRAGPHRIEYPAAALNAMPPALRHALESSPNRLI